MVMVQEQIVQRKGHTAMRGTRHLLALNLRVHSWLRVAALALSLVQVPAVDRALTRATFVST